MRLSKIAINAVLYNSIAVSIQTSVGLVDKGDSAILDIKSLVSKEFQHLVFRGSKVFPNKNSCLGLRRSLFYKNVFLEDAKRMFNKIHKLETSCKNVKALSAFAYIRQPDPLYK